MSTTDTTATSESLPAPIAPIAPNPLEAGPLLAAPPPSPRVPIVLNPVLGVIDTLSDAEYAELMACEAVIQETHGSFVQAGLALARIRDGQLYRAEFDSFEAYYRAKWDLEHAQVYYLMGSAQLFTSLATLPDLPKPANALQVRPLIGLAPDAAQAAWRHVVTKNDGRKITARLVKRAVRVLGLAGKPKSDRPPVRAERLAQREAIRGVIGELLMLISQREAHDVLLEKVQALDHHFERLFALDRKR